MTVYEVVNWYIKAKRVRWAPRTLEQYEYLRDRYCQRVPIEPAAIESCWIQLIEDGHARTAQLLYKLIRAACRRAKKYRMIAEDPTEYMDPVEHKPEMRDYWTLEEARAFLSATEGSEMHLAWSLMLGLGLRRGELLGLKWSDVDTYGKTVNIQSQRYRYNNQIIEARTKSRTSKRKLHITPSIAKELNDYKRKHPWTPYVINESPERLRKLFRNACKQAGVRPIPLHGLRHTFATVAVENGESLRVIQTMLGHASYQVTEQHYAHVTERAIMHAADGVQRAISSDS